MSLTADEMKSIMVDTLNNRKPRVQSSEALEFQKEIRDDMEMCKKKGWVMSIPGEWEV
jgi:hypothetical protein